ncbi:MAG: lysophospholipase [Granulosicoccus sp.]|nr:lysophospholipase [Granulosicoccus sp.]
MTEWITTPWKDHGQTVQLEMLVRKPSGEGPFPTVVFNHGSTGSGRDPRRFNRTVDSPEVTSFFNSHGWMVLYPQRRGRGGSGGEYREGISPQRRGYSCDKAVALEGFARAMDDLTVVMDHVGKRADVVGDCILLAGASRGGALAVAWAGQRPDSITGVINFSGGWLGRACASSYADVNNTVFLQGASFRKPMLWLQGKSDTYYGLNHCRSNFENFRAAGGQGSFYVLQSGHNLVSRSDLWEGLVDSYLHSVGGAA